MKSGYARLGLRDGDQVCKEVVRHQLDRGGPHLANCINARGTNTEI